MGHIGKKLQFPRTRHSRDRIAERAIRGGGLEICALSSLLRQLPARVLFVGQARLGKGLRGAILEKSFSFRARGTPVIGLRNERQEGGAPCHHRCANFSRVLFVGQGSLTRKRIAAGHIGKKLQFPRARHSRDRIAERAMRGGG